MTGLLHVNVGCVSSKFDDLLLSQTSETQGAFPNWQGLDRGLAMCTITWITSQILVFLGSDLYFYPLCSMAI